MDITVPRLRLPLDLQPHLTPLMQKGFRVEIETGNTLQSLLCDQWGFPMEYVTERISTLFLNGKPVDDMVRATVPDRAVLALSSAMPGLVGAVMRRGGFFSSLRDGITHRENGLKDQVRNGLITVKLFNLLIREMGPRFLMRGILVDRNDLPDSLTGMVDGGATGSGSIFIVADTHPEAGSHVTGP